MMSATVSGALAMAAVGAVIYALSFRHRRTLQAPIISSVGKKFVGGALMLCAAAVLAYWYVKLRA